MHAACTYLKTFSSHELMHAVCAYPEPLVVFVDPENEENTYRFYLMFSGLVADYVQQGLSIACTAHTGEKGCIRCFMLGGNTLPGGTALSTQRWWGLHHLADAEMFQTAPTPGGDETTDPVVAMQSRVGLHFAAEVHATYTVFDRELAQEIQVSHEHHMIRVRTAERARAKAKEKFVTPSVLPSGARQEDHEERRKGANSLHWYAAMNRLPGK
jgi:hypothetical protein